VAWVFHPQFTSVVNAHIEVSPERRSAYISHATSPVYNANTHLAGWVWLALSPSPQEYVDQNNAKHSRGDRDDSNPSTAQASGYTTKCGETTDR